MDTIKPCKLKRKEKGFFAFADFYGGGGQAFISVVYFFFLTNIIGLLRTAFDSNKP